MWWTKRGINQFSISLSIIVYILACVTHLQDGDGAVHLACEGGQAHLVKTLVDEFGMSLDIRDNVST